MNELIRINTGDRTGAGRGTDTLWCLNKAVTVRDTGSVNPGSRAIFGSGSGSSILF